MANHIEKLPGVQVEDITDLVEWYIDHLSLDPVSNQQYTAEQITGIMCKFPVANWAQTEISRLFMECCLLRETISDLRLDAITYVNTLNDIENTTKANKDAIAKLYEIADIVELARNMGV